MAMGLPGYSLTRNLTHLFAKLYLRNAILPSHRSAIGGKESPDSKEQPTGE